ncbi:hypothetical protein WJX77_009821 [Trebouxia sp. C0004]
MSALNELNELQDPLKFSSCGVAAARAVESRLADRLYNDPLAEVLAGPKSLELGTQVASGKGSRESLSQQASFYGYSSADSNQPRKLGWVTLRTRYLDDALAKVFAQFEGQHCQTVLLGAGMDARPWRLPSMHSVSWYDLDQHEVLDLKGRLLEAAGASKKHGQKAKHPLHAGSYTSAVVDLNSPSWSETLINAGFKQEVPAVWLAEGLLNYLTQEQNEALLHTLHKMSAPGSTFLGTLASEAWEQQRVRLNEGGHFVNLRKYRKWGGPNKIAEMEKFLRANQWEPIRLDSGEAATKQIGPQYEYGAKLDPGTGTPEEIEYLHLFVTATPIAIGTFD